MDILVNALLWFAAVSVGIMAGVYFTFSAFVMRSLDAIEAPSGMLAMQSINRIIVKSAFLPLFFASTLACAGLVIVAALDLTTLGSNAMLTGGGAYVAGMFGVTILGNVPLNDRLEATAADGPAAAEIWSIYMRKWVAWNHLRTLACTISLVLLIGALVERF